MQAGAEASSGLKSGLGARFLGRDVVTVMIKGYVSLLTWGNGNVGLWGPLY